MLAPRWFPGVARSGDARASNVCPANRDSGNARWLGGRLEPTAPFAIATDSGPTRPPLARLARSRQHTSTLLHGAWHYARARLTSTPVWTSVTLLVTLRCEQRCAYCDFPRHAESELETSEILRLIAGLRRTGTVRLAISGGEPLLRDDLEVILAEARRQGLFTSLVTSGVGLEQRPSLLDNVDYLLCTVEGSPRSHESSRGAGSHAQVVRALRAARRYSHLRLGLICPVHAGNTDDLTEVLQLARELDARAYFQPVQRRLGWHGPDLVGALDGEQTARVFTRLLWRKALGEPVGNSRAYLKLLREPHRRFSERACAAGRYFVTLLPDGRVTPCCMVPFSADLPRVDLLDPRRTFDQLAPPQCDGCTISPYVETSLLLAGRLGAWKDLARWPR